MVNKDLGMVTAYAYAVSKGYTGTEEEFAELMADYADVGERAEAAATAAAASASAASGFASDSADSATLAEGFAGNASTSAGNASQAAQNASQSATAASGSATSAAGSATAAAGSATTAGNKATEAAQSATEAAGSATTAGTAATNAQTAQTAAEAAQTAAETAQGAAEDAAESVEGKAAQIDQNTEDISLLKSHLEATYITDTVSGAIASFADGADGIPVKSLTVGIGPIQSGTGDPSPENIRPISGRQSVTIIRTGDRNNTGWTRNMSVGEDGSINTGAGSDYYCSPFIPAKTIVYLDIQAMAGGSRYFSIAAYDANKNFIAIVRRGPISATSHRVESYNLPEGTVYVVISFGKGTNGKINYVVGDYDPRYTVQLGDTVYGGSLDVTTGVLTVTYAEYKCSAVDVDGWSLAQSGQDSGSGKYYAIIKKTVATPYGKTANNGDGRGLFNMGEWRYSSNSKWRAYTTTDKQLTFVVIVDTDITTTEALNTFLATLSEPLQACYELATPVTVQLTGQTLTTLKGQNNIWSNAGDVAVDYVADTKLYIEQLTEPDADMVADANITSGQYFMVGNALFLATANIANGAAIVPGTNCTRTNLAEALNAINA